MFKVKFFLVLAVVILLSVGVIYAAELLQPLDNNGRPIGNALTPSTHHAVAISAVSSSSTGTISSKIVRVTSTASAYVKMGLSTAAATTSDMYMGSGVVEYYDMKENDRIAGLSTAGAGTLHVTEMR